MGEKVHTGTTSSTTMGVDDQEVLAFIPTRYERDIDENKVLFMYPFAEFIGSMFLTMLTCGGIVTAGALTYQYELTELSAGRLLSLAIQNGMVYMCLVYTMTSLSKAYRQSDARQKRRKTSNYALNFPVGHLNPAVTFAVVLSGDVPPTLGVTYFFSQVFGSVAGCLLVYGVLPGASKTNVGATVVGTKATSVQALGMEMTVTFILVLCIIMFLVNNGPELRSTTTPHDKIAPPFEHMAPFIIGLVVMCTTFLAADVSGASMNPARSFASAIVSGVWSEHWVYWVGPYTGALLAWFVGFLGRRCV